MLNAVLYVFLKRENSTKQPGSNTAHLEVSININDGNSSVLAPQIRLTPFQQNNELVANFTIYNYVFIEDFARYYYISNWLYNADGSWTAICTVDVLASWKSYILISNGYVGRACRSSYWNDLITDSFYPPSKRYICLKSYQQTGLTPDITHSFYVIGVISADAPTMGAVKYYMTNIAQLQTLVTNLVSTSSESWSSVTSLTSDALKSLVNPLQFIVSCKWFPMGALAVGTGSPIIRCYSWDTGARGVAIDANNSYSRYPAENAGTSHTGWYELNYPEITFSDLNVTATEISNGWSDDWGDLPTYGGDLKYYFPHYSPYAQYNLLTPWGVFDLEADVIANCFEMAEGTKIRWALTDVNFISGTAIFEVQAIDMSVRGNHPAWLTLFRREVPIALDIPLAQASISYVDVAKATMNAVGNAGNAREWFRNPIGNAAGIANNIIDATAAAMSPSVQSTGSGQATFSDIIKTITFQQKRFKTTPQSVHSFGRAVKRYAQVQNVRDGTDNFVQMDTIEFAAPCTDAETKEVTRYMLEGVFVE